MARLFITWCALQYCYFKTFNRKWFNRFHSRDRQLCKFIEIKETFTSEKKTYNIFLLVNPFCRFFRQFWLAAVGNLFILTDEVNKMLSWSTFQTTAIYDEVFKASLCDFWDRDILRRTAKSHRYLFLRWRCLRFVTNWLWRSVMYEAAPVIDGPSSLEETGHYIYCAAR